MVQLAHIFQHKTANKQKLKEHGFIKHGKTFQKSIPFMQDQFTMTIFIEDDGTISYKVFDNTSHEEYVLVHVSNATGSFINEIHQSCENILLTIADTCFDSAIFKAEQFKKIIQTICHTYDAQPEFLWKQYPNYAAFRRKDNKNGLPLSCLLIKAN